MTIAMRRRTCAKEDVGLCGLPGMVASPRSLARPLCFRSRPLRISKFVEWATRNIHWSS
jgi:hypothetical protein